MTVVGSCLSIVWRHLHLLHPLPTSSTFHLQTPFHLPCSANLSGSFLSAFVKCCQPKHLIIWNRLIGRKGCTWVCLLFLYFRDVNYFGKYQINGKERGGYHGGRQGASHNKGDMHCFLHLRYPCAAIPMITSPIDMIFYYYLLLHICNKYCNCKSLNILTIALKSCFDTLRKSRCQLLLLLTTSNVKVPPPLQVLQTLFWAASISWLHLV